MVRTARIIGLDLQSFLFDNLSGETESWGSMSDSGEFAPSDGEAPLSHRECHLAASYNPEKSDSYQPTHHM